MRISGSMWSVPAGEQRERLAQAREAGLEVLHWDTTDGEFAAPGGFRWEQAADLIADAGGIESEAHLMLADPTDSIDRWADFCQTLIIPLEIADPWGAFSRIERRGIRPALAVSLHTPLESVPVGSFPVLVMAITPGEAGAPFDPAAVSRAAALSRRGCHEWVGVDGGVGPAHFDQLGPAGVNWVVSGGSLFGATDTAAWLRDCRSHFPG